MFSMLHLFLSLGFLENLNNFTTLGRLEINLEPIILPMLKVFPTMHFFKLSSNFSMAWERNLYKYNAGV